MNARKISQAIHEMLFMLFRRLQPRTLRLRLHEAENAPFSSSNFAPYEVNFSESAPEKGSALKTAHDVEAASRKKKFKMKPRSRFFSFRTKSNR